LAGRGKDGGWLGILWERIEWRLVSADRVFKGWEPLDDILDVSNN